MDRPNSVDFEKVAFSHACVSHDSIHFCDETSLVDEIAKF